MYTKRGFTLIELLVVIAIIGILSSVVLVSLNSARSRGRVAAAQQTMKTLQTGAIICMDDGDALVAPTATQDGGGGAICSGSASTWTQLPTGWVYSTTISSSPSAGTFSFSAAGDSKTITCTQNACTTS